MRARLDRWSVLLLLGASVYLALTLGASITRTELIEQDSAHYCEVAERCARGQGLTSLCDRRGVVVTAERPPVPFDGATLWPALLAPLVAITGEARTTGSVVSLLGLIGALWLGTLAVRGLGASPLPAAFCVTAALLTRKACSIAVLPLTDGASLLATTAVMLALVRRRPVLAAGLCALAVAVRFQNAALLLPLLAALTPRAWRGRTVAAASVLALLAALWTSHGQAAEGVVVFLDPTHRDSLLRALRFLALPLLVGAWYARRWPEAWPFWLLGLGHLLVLLAHHDASDERGWMFANRHGLPFHLLAAALAALALARLRGWPRVLVFAAVAAAAAENAPRPYKTLSKTHERTGRPEVVLALQHLRRHPLPGDALVLCHDCDVLALELGIAGVHLRGHEPDAGAGDDPFLLPYLRLRGISHVLLTWSSNRHLALRNERMTAFERCLLPACAVAADLRAPGGQDRALLLRVPQ